MVTALLALLPVTCMHLPKFAPAAAAALLALASCSADSALSSPANPSLLTHGPTASTCSTPQPGWIWCDDFEVDRTPKYFEYDSAGGAFVRMAGAGRNGSMGMRTRFAAGQVNAGSLKLSFGKVPESYFRPVDAGTTVYRDIYWRMWVRNQAGWVGGGGDKLSRAMGIVAGDWRQSMVAHVWSGTDAQANQLFVDPASGTDTAGTVLTTGYNDWGNWRWLGRSGSITPIFDAAHVGQWHCVEAHAKLNDAGLSNGVEEIYIDGVHEARRMGLNFVGRYDSYGINVIFVENYWNAGSPATQERYIDGLVVSTQPIGCAS